MSPQKSKAIVGLSKILVNKYDSVVPKNFEQLEELPGVGHKTASVVMSQAFGVPAFPVDTHIHRLAWRWALSTRKSVERTEKDLKRLFPEESWNKLHLQMIYFGREYCPAISHKKIYALFVVNMGVRGLNNMDVNLSIAFIFGALSFFSPCVLPLVPVILQYFQKQKKMLEHV